MSPSPLRPHTVRTRPSVAAFPLLPLLALLVLPAVLAGCGGGQEEGAVLASVGKKDITASYYEDRLATMKKEELPRSEEGVPLDMSLLEGKKKFLETLINKEVMVQTAENLGFQNDASIMGANKALTSYHASIAMWDKVIQEPAKTISPEELEAFYEKMGSTRKCLYVICNFLDDAEAARKAALEGADWEDIVRDYHDGNVPPNRQYDISIPFGRYNIEFETGVFDTEIGGVTRPINTAYGYWVLKVLGEKAGERPSMEESMTQILDVTWNRKMAQLKEDFKQSVMEQYQLTIHEDALWKCYLALPEGETLFREGTQDPHTQDELQPLDIKTEDLDLPFYSYLGEGGEFVELSLLDYKIIFDKMGVFQRPKASEMLGGLRNKMEGELINILLNIAAQDRGFFEDPDVRDKVDLKIEEMMVNKLYNEVVQIEELVTPDELQAFWDENSQNYISRENREGRLVICRNLEEATEARAKAASGTAWKDILVAYGTEMENKSRAGKLEGVLETIDEPISNALFSIQPGELSEPFALVDDRYGVVRLDSVNPEFQRELGDIGEAVAQQIREIRKEEVFQAMIAKWKNEIPVTVHEENLDSVASWEELTSAKLSGKQVDPS